MKKKYKLNIIEEVQIFKVTATWLNNHQDQNR